MTDQLKKHPRFQIHLSTAVVLMFVAGLLLNANINGKRGQFIVAGPNDGNAEVTRLYGWPFLPEYMTAAENIQYNGFGDWTIPSLFYWSLDAFVALILLFTTWALCEWGIRLRSKSIEQECDDVLNR